MYIVSVFVSVDSFVVVPGTAANADFGPMTSAAANTRNVIRALIRFTVGPFS
jgi:hypothetical protein